MTDPRPNDGPRPFPAAPDSFEESSSSRFDAEVDFSSERPSSTMHGPRPSASVMKLVGGLVGGSLLLAGIVTLVRGDDDDTQEAAVAAKSSEVEPVAASLAAPLEHAIIALEPARMESITASAVRGMTDKPTRRELARRSAEATSENPAAPSRPAGATTPSAASHGSATPPTQPAHHGDDATPARTVEPTSVRDLPPPPQPDAPSDDVEAATDEPARSDDAATPSVPSDDAAKPSAPADEPAPSEPDDRSSAPS